MAHCCFRIFFLTLSYVTFVLKVNCVFFFFLTHSNIKVKLLMCAVVFCLVRQISFSALSGDCGSISRASLPRTSTLSFQFIPNNPRNRETIHDPKTAWVSFWWGRKPEYSAKILKSQVEINWKFSPHTINCCSRDGGVINEPDLPFWSRIFLVNFFISPWPAFA